MKAYKGFNKDMTCRGFQYKEGGEYETDRAKVCESGFHACENPIECLLYYDAGSSVYHEVELDGDIKRSSGDSKCAATKIKIGARLSIPALCKATFEFVRSKCTNEHNAENGRQATAGDGGAATAGEYGAATAGYRGAATAGYRGAATAGYGGAATAGYGGAATAGEYGAATAGYGGAATAGEYGAATAGDRGAATAGYRGAATAGYGGAATAGDGGAATAGEYGAATAGDRGAATAGDGGAATAGNGGAATAGEYGAATAGYGGAATSRGSVTVGKYGIGCVRGNNIRARGGSGAVLVFVEERQLDDGIKAHETIVIDDKKYKPDTWYTLRDGKVVEAEEG